MAFSCHEKAINTLLMSLESKGCPGERRNAEGLKPLAVRSLVVHKRHALAGFHVSGGTLWGRAYRQSRTALV